MQSLDWYVRRLRSMSPTEIAWRIRFVLRDVVERPRFALGLYPGLTRALPAARREFVPGFRVADVKVGEWNSPTASRDEQEWCRRLLERADRIAQHHLSLFNLVEHDLGDPIDWNRDYSSGIVAPTTYAPHIDYRDFSVTGDCKLVWELNRHHHLVVLARAYRASGNRRYAEAVVDQLGSWWSQCPFGYGMSWRSPLELGVRLINWVWAIDLILDSGVIDEAIRTRLLHSAYLHLWETTRKLSRGSSANNHLIGEAAGVFVGASYFQHFPEAASWRAAAWNVLATEIERQTHPDGGGREQAIGYQLFVLQFFLVSAVVAERTGIAIPEAFRKRLEHMIDFLVGLSAGGPLPMLGDADDGYVLDLERAGGDLDGILCVGAILFNRGDWKAQVDRFTESARWLLDASSRPHFERLPSSSPGSLLSRAFPDTGLYLLQCGTAGADDCISVVVDCAELGFGNIAAHGHADALSFVFRAFGRDIFVDPGTYDYFSHPTLRSYFRSTLAHNTVQVDAVSQSEMQGKFLWGQRAVTRCLAWAPGPDGGHIVGEHDGYLRLPDPVLHRRRIELDGRARRMTIRDELLARGTHQISLAFHLTEHCDAASEAPNRFRITTDEGAVVLRLDPRLSARALHGSDDPIAGWVSRGYHRRSAATTILASCEISGAAALVCEVDVEPRTARSGSRTSGQ